MSSDSAAGTVIAEATPWSARATRSEVGPVETPPRSDATARSERPVRKMPRRPYRSPSRPNRSERPAAGSAKAVVTQGRLLTPRRTAFPTTGRATFRIEKSADIIKLAPRSSTTVSRCRSVIPDNPMISDVVMSSLR